MARSESLQGYAECGEPSRPITVKELMAGVLHGTAHVWIWRRYDMDVEILLQKRSYQSKTWPGFWDISTAGHIDAGETPLVAAVREASEEIGIEITPSDLSLVGVYRWKQKAVSDYDVTENEFQWVYTYEMGSDRETDFSYEESEVGGTKWISLATFEDLVTKKSDLGTIIDHDKEYYAALMRHIDTQVS